MQRRSPLISPEDSMNDSVFEVLDQLFDGPWLLIICYTGLMLAPACARYM